MDFIKYFIKAVPIYLGIILLPYLALSGKIPQFIDWYAFELKLPDIVKLILLLLLFFDCTYILYKSASKEDINKNM